MKKIVYAGALESEFVKSKHTGVGTFSKCRTPSIMTEISMMISKLKTSVSSFNSSGPNRFITFYPLSQVIFVGLKVSYKDVLTG
ncbi:MAG: hypothetical protein JW776_02665 [Candidatus Lokiarchaeota archaeon]|nr:hypothetical protein [Candidatus Lokiarchaeota archaeon]